MDSIPKKMKHQKPVLGIMIIYINYYIVSSSLKEVINLTTPKIFRDVYNSPFLQKISLFL